MKLSDGELNAPRAGAARTPDELSNLAAPLPSRGPGSEFPAEFLDVTGSSQLKIHSCPAHQAGQVTVLLEVNSFDSEVFVETFQAIYPFGHSQSPPGAYCSQKRG